MEKLKMETPDMAQVNIEKIAELFPEVVKEASDGQGGLKRKIDLDALRQLLAPSVFDEDEERYDFTWVGKKKAAAEAGTPIRKTLRPCVEESKDWENTGNLYIEGDNLDALKLLQESYLGKVKMIYIDPPYNTGHDFIYKDDFKMSAKEYNEGLGVRNEEGDIMFRNTDTNGRFHSDWCSMMYPRLKLARNLLSDDGVIFISIDDNEVDNLKKICNEIFGEINLVAEVPWQSRSSIQNDTDFSVNHEYICIYAKKRRLRNRRLKESNYSEWHEKDSFVCKPLPLDKSKFDNPDNDSRGLWKADPLDAPNIRPNLTYPIINPNTGEEHLPPRGRCWRFLPEKLSDALADNRIIWTNNGRGRPQLKVFYEEKKEFGSVDNSWFSAEKIGTSTNGTKELMKLFDGHIYFETPKPISLLLKLITLANTRNNSIILDFFSGSATTAHAVMQLNAEDGGNRKFIMVQLPEECDEKSEAYKAGYKNVCEIGKERIRRAGEKIKAEIEESNRQLKIDEEPKAVPDIGFRVLKIDSTNMKDVYYGAAETNQVTLDDLVSNIKEDRTDLDLLFGVLTDLGLPLGEKHEVMDIDGVRVHNYDDLSLVACFEENVPESVIRKIASLRSELTGMEPMRAVFRDSSFPDDPSRINVEEIFKLKAPATEVKVI